MAEERREGPRNEWEVGREGCKEGRFGRDVRQRCRAVCVCVYVCIDLLSPGF